jgi:multisubunit Na+/H+ antiporter MnhC subunit
MKPYRQNQTHQNTIAIKTIWQKLLGTHEYKYAQLVSSQNNALIEKNKVTKELKPLASGMKLGSIITAGLIVFAGVFDMVFWTDMFKDVTDNETIQRAIALTLACLVAWLGTIIGRNLAERQLRKNQEDDYTPEQLAVFHRNTRHDYAKPLMAVLAIVALLLPAVRWTTLPNDSSRLINTVIFTSLSYFVMACVIGIEWYFHCPWQNAINKAEKLYETASADREKENKVIVSLGQELTNLDPEQDKVFLKWLAQDQFQLITDSATFNSFNSNDRSPKYGKPTFKALNDEQVFDKVV